MFDDRQLLRQYVEEGSETAFGELVTRYVNLIYSAALRRTGGDAHLAQDVAQLVFTDLARKAGSLPGDVVLSGWLHRASRFAAAQMMRTEHRRQAREQEAVMMNALKSGPEPDWHHIRPLLDEALDTLGDADRDALLLRFFEQRNLADVGRAIGANEDTARKRVTRALEKLRVRLVRRGVSTTGMALSAALTANAVHAAPAGLATTLVNGSLAGAISTAGTFTLINFMALTKLQFGVSAFLIVGATTALVLQHQTLTRLRAENDRLQQQNVPAAPTDDAAPSIVAAKSLSPSEQDELLRLRGEVTRLRQQTNALATLLAETLRSRSPQPPPGIYRSPAEPEADPARQAVIAKLGDTKMLLLSFFLYADDNTNQFPTNLDQTAPYLQDAKAKGDFTGTNQFEQLYVGPLSAVKNPATGIVVREAQPSYLNGKWVKAYGFADGHAEIHSEPDGNFEAWERERVVQLKTGGP